MTTNATAAATRPPVASVIITAVAIAVLLMLAALACSTSAAPDECVAAAADAGAPDAVIRQLENPGDLNAAERIILNRTLQRLGVDDVCSVAAQLPEQDGESASPSTTVDGNGNGDDQPNREPTSQTPDADSAPTIQAPDADDGQRTPDAGTNRVEASPLDQEADTETCLHAALSRGVNDSLVDEIRRTNAASLTDRQRIRWGRTLSENGIKGQCAGLWSEPVTAANADKRNARHFAECQADLRANLESRRDSGDWHRVAYYQDYLQLLARPYVDLDAADRVVLRQFLSEQGGNSGNCAVGYPQLYSGRWIPADADR